MWFPYTAFVFRYKKVPNGFVYPGFVYDLPVEQVGMRVLFRNEPFVSTKDSVGHSPTEHHLNSCVCLEHIWDGTCYKTPRILIDKILNTWWASQHVVYNNWMLLKDWANMSKKDVLNYNWPPCDPIDTKALPPWINKPIRFSKTLQFTRPQAVV